MHSELESHKTKIDCLELARKVSPKEVAAIRGVGEGQTALLDAVGARMAELKSLCYESSASTTTCRKELLQVQNNLVAPHKKLKTTSARAIVITMKRDAATTKYEELRLSAEQRVGFANKKHGSC